jgi:hypothetical protein
MAVLSSSSIYNGLVTLYDRYLEDKLVEGETHTVRS